MHWTASIRRVFLAFSEREADFRFQALLSPAVPRRGITQTVETVERVTFQKLTFEKWEKNVEKHLVFGVPHSILAIFWQLFSLLWEIFVNIFRTRGFSTVSLGAGFL
jgi:hypothetical protein